jgi:copper transport protein
VRSAARRVLVVAALAAVIVVALAAPAFAHAQLESTNPAPGAVLTGTPNAITLEFSEPVTVALGGIRLFDENGDRIATDPPTKPAGNTVSTETRGKLANGSYVVTWRVTSADTHPIQGAFTFQIGTGGNATGRDVTSLADRLLADQRGTEVVGDAWGVARFLAFAGIAVLIGSVAFCVAVWSRARTFRAARVITYSGLGVLAFATLAGFLLQGPYAAGLGLSHVFDTALWRDVAATRFGTVWLARLGLLAVAFVLVRMLFARSDRTRLPTWWLVVAGAAAVAIAATPALAGHSTTGEYVGLALFASVVHVLAMSVWLGGLVLMAVVVLRGNEIEERRDVVLDFSFVATWCVLALIASGAFQTWRQVRNLDALRDTDFGHILVVKLVVFALMGVFALFSREIVGRVFDYVDGDDEDEAAAVGSVATVSGGAVDTGDAADDGGSGEARVDARTGLMDLDPEVRGEWRNLRRSAWAEALLGIVILAVTAVLVNATPAVTANAGAGEGAAGVTMRSNQVVVDVTVAPAQAGRNDIHVSTFTPAGAPMDVAELTVTFDLPSREIAAIDVPLRKLGPGHYLSPGFNIPIAGDWRIVAKARLTDVDQVTLTDTVTIR